MFSIKKQETTEAVEFHLNKKTETSNEWKVAVTGCTETQCFMYDVTVPKALHSQYAPSLSIDEFTEKALQFLAKKVGIAGIESPLSLENVASTYASEFGSIFS